MEVKYAATTKKSPARAVTAVAKLEGGVNPDQNPPPPSWIPVRKLLMKTNMDGAEITGTPLPLFGLLLLEHGTGLLDCSEILCWVGFFFF